MVGNRLQLVQCVLLFCFLTVIKSDVIVNTSSGKVAGKEVASILKNEKYYSFLGIPYAEPPIGKLRFMPPQPHPGWDDVLDAKKERKICAQYNLPMRKIKRVGYCGDEDCLHLSIHTPKLPSDQDSKLPVIVFLYNENFRVSYNASKDYGPDFFMKEDVIFVTINHRLGSLGFLSFEDDLLPGNNGFRDVLLALKWLQVNIHNFSGDPRRVTLMGNSGGAALVDILLHSPKAKGLFSGAILQSGTSWNSLYFDKKARERAIALSEAVEQEATTSSFLIKRFLDVSAEMFVISEHLVIHADEARALQRPILSFGPTIEHDHPEAVITKLPEDNTDGINVPVMIGYNSREAIASTERFLHKPQYLTFADRDFVVLMPIRTNYHFKIHSKVYNNAIEEIKEFYFDEGYVKISRPGEYMDYLGDIMSFYPVDYTVSKYVNVSSAPVYYYTFDYSGEFNIRKKETLEEAQNIDGTWGASLGDELCYLFVCNPIRKSYKKALEDEDSEEIKVLRNMVRLWANFSKSGNPTPPESEFTWTPATKENKECLVISDELEMKNNLHEERVKFWDNFIAKYREKAIDGVVEDLKDEL